MHFLLFHAQYELFKTQQLCFQVPLVLSTYKAGTKGTTIVMKNTLDWTGLDWTGLDRKQLDWIGILLIHIRSY